MNQRLPVIGALACLALAFSIVAPTASAQWTAPASSGVTSVDVLNIVADAGINPSLTAAQTVAVVQDAGSLNHAARDTYANAFVASGLASDGGTAAYGFINARDTKWKMGGGELNELRPSGNTLSFANGETVFTTARFAQPACLASTSCRWYSDLWFGVIPGTPPSCTAGDEGGFKPDSVTKEWVYCNGTANQNVAFTDSWGGALNFAVFAGAGCQTLTFAATGAVRNEKVVLGGGGDVFDADADLSAEAAVATTDVVSVRLCCADAAGCADPGSIDFTAAPLR